MNNLENWILGVIYFVSQHIPHIVLIISISTTVALFVQWIRGNEHLLFAMCISLVTSSIAAIKAIEWSDKK